MTDEFTWTSMSLALNTIEDVPKKYKDVGLMTKDDVYDYKQLKFQENLSHMLRTLAYALIRSYTNVDELCNAPDNELIPIATIELSYKKQIWDAEFKAKVTTSA